jgi:2-oxoglutarate ferredoxin oxidoreductase subunit alpha
MNPAALKTNLADLKQNGILILDKEEFNEANLKKAQYEKTPLDDGSLDKYQVYPVEITKMTSLALKDMSLPNRSVMRCRNFFALGVVSGSTTVLLNQQSKWIQERFRRNTEVLEVNRSRSKLVTIWARMPDFRFVRN